MKKRKLGKVVGKTSIFEFEVFIRFNFDNDVTEFESDAIEVVRDVTEIYDQPSNINTNTLYPDLTHFHID